MKRRNFITVVGGGLVQAAVGGAVGGPAAAIAAKAGKTVRTRVRPRDAGWPSAKEWGKLRQVVGDANLLRPSALFGSCATDANGAACADVMKNMRNPFYISDQPGGTEVSGWLDAWTPAASEYAVAAHSASQVAAGVNFARDHNLRLAVKGTGHSYLGTSNAADSLLIWTHAMNQVRMHDAFVGQGCEGKVAATPAVSAESGAMWIDLYDAVTTRGGRYVQGGGCTSVGVAGLVQSGGFGSFSKGFGTAAAGLLEAEIVTADGQVRVANACTNPDLYWALRGGGGGTWGVVTRVTLRTHDLPANFDYAVGKVKAQSDEAFKQLIARAMDHYADNLFNPHWGEQMHFDRDNTFEISMVGQGLDGEQVKKVWEPFFDFLKGSKDFTVERLVAGAAPARLWWDVVAREARGNHSMIRDPRPGAPASHAWWSGDQDQVGAYLHGYDSLWLPATLLKKEERGRLAEALFAASRHHQLEMHFNKGIAGAPAEAVAAVRETATNPKVADAFVLVIIADGERPSYPGLARPAMDMAAARENKRQIDLAAAELRKVAPEAGSYVSESNFFNERWQEEYWGTNYPKLRAVKKKYDPEGMFVVHHGVGSEEWSADGFTRVDIKQS